MSSPTARVADPAAPVLPTWSYADRIRKIRRDVLGIEQSEMAERLGIGRQRYAAWETGRSVPRDVVEIAKRIEMVSKVPASWTLGIDAPTTPSGGSFPTTPPTTRHLSLVSDPERDASRLPRTAAA